MFGPPEALLKHTHSKSCCLTHEPFPIYHLSFQELVSFGTPYLLFPFPNRITYLPSNLTSTNLKKLKNMLPQSQLCIVYYALVEGQLHYGDIARGSSIPFSAPNTGSQNKIIKNAKIKDTWSCPGISAESIICFDMNAMTYKIIHILYPDTIVE